MDIVINDANILIDLVKLDLLESFVKLNFKFYTTDFVFDELNSEQSNPIFQLNKRGIIKIIETKEIEEYEAIH